MKDKEYFKIPLLSYSRLARFDESGAKSINEEFGESNQEFYALGALTEEIIQGDLVSLKENFIISDFVRPTASLGDLADEMLANNAELKGETAMVLARALGLWSNVKKDEVYLKKFDTKEFWGYLKLYRNKGDRKIVSPKLFDLATEMAKGITEGMFTKDIFESNAKRELLYQEVILWNNETYKSKLDLMVIDHNLKSIIPYDIKTSAFPAEEFKSQFYKFRYYIQSSMYTDALEEWRLEHYPEYLLKPFQFIVVSRENPSTALTFTVDETMIDKGRDGIHRDDGSLMRKGYKQLTEEFNWHVDSQQFDFSFTTYENKGNILIE